ncbi:hypothetical protein DACRYDRAFT_22574 [Dacryopinax primogenitus]|uniref:Uncharacterized protein n=1 Tax=Dacryopinax primogenitus (strain DJM 731) TaxID=1858805 RepID=M5G6I4_DACPD|nr:uncharacterized protein DACRYDRAFT_22574 [Dacryopinax primogenitus]EJU01432.1 hypothetical protein DACRYDRAFT_22574 [Dacryopinax primogenitus]
MSTKWTRPCRPIPYSFRICKSNTDEDQERYKYPYPYPCTGHHGLSPHYLATSSNSHEYYPSCIWAHEDLSRTCLHRPHAWTTRDNPCTRCCDDAKGRTA